MLSELRVAPQRSPHLGSVGERRPALGAEIARRRRARGWTQTNFADAASISVATVEKLEAAPVGRRVSPGVQASISEALGCEVDEIFGSSVPGISFAEAAQLSGYSTPILLAAIHEGSLPVLSSSAPDPDPLTVPDVLGLRAVGALRGVSRECALRAVHAGALPATQNADGSWAVTRDAALRWRPKRQAAYRLDPDQVRHWAAAKKQAADARRVSGQCATCGAPVSRPRSAVSSSEGRLYCSADHYHADPDHRGVRSELMPGAGGCGSPTCSDSACEVAHGGCHGAGCDKPALIAPNGSRVNRWVRGLPTRYCSASCALSSHNTGVTLAGRIRELKAGGAVHTIGVAARKMSRPPELVRRHVRRLGLGVRVRGDGSPGDPIRLTDDDLDRLVQHVQPYADLVFRQRSIEWLERWYRATYGHRLPNRLYGRYTAAAVRRSGTKITGRPMQWTPTEVLIARMRELREAGGSKGSFTSVARRVSSEFHVELNADHVRYWIRRGTPAP